MDEEIKSKSQKKRDAAQLRQVGIELTDLSEEKLNKLPLPDHLREALRVYRGIKSNGAKKRQAQLIGKLMRAEDSEPIIAAYEQILAEGSAQTADFHALEIWRERLINEGKEALTSFIEQHQSVDVQLLRQHIKKAIDEKQSGKNLGAAKALFRFLRSCQS